MSAYNQVRQCSSFQMSSDITPTAHITKAELPLTCLNTYVHPNPTPALEALMGFQ